ncbi:Crp/Fnr family transcriptional regulator [Lachnospiraceae bacterium NSJ-143]|nr:Crp/Fnr family transcriptional regulator [Lachnospiraceae bacterium NSJ-143]
MDEYIGILQKSAFFKGMDCDEIVKAVDFLDGKRRIYKKGQYIFRAGDNISSVGFVLDGQARIEKEDYYGNRSIIASIARGDIFGEVYACRENNAISVNVFAAEDTAVLMLSVGNIFSESLPEESFCGRITHNLISILAEKAFILNRKIEHVTKRTTREKLMSFFSEQAVISGCPEFDIRFNRQELADFLCVDRSAMSGELSKMRQEGIISYSKNHFKLH